MKIREHVAQIIDDRLFLSGRHGLGGEIADRLIAEGLVNQPERYESLGELVNGDRIMLPAEDGPMLYVVDRSVSFESSGDTEVIGVLAEYLGDSDHEPVLILSGPTNMHVRKLVG